MASVATAIGAAAPATIARGGASISERQMGDTQWMRSGIVRGGIGASGTRAPWLVSSRGSRSRRAVTVVRATSPGDSAPRAAAREVTLGAPRGLGAGFLLTPASLTSGRRRVRCSAKRRSKIPDNVGFDYDEFDEFVGTGPSSSKKKEKTKDDSHLRDEFGNLLTAADIEPPPDPVVGPLPDWLSFASPLVPGHRIEEAKALQLQRAWAREVWREIGEFPSRDSEFKVAIEPVEGKGKEKLMDTFKLGENSEPYEIRRLTDEEYDLMYNDFMNTVGRAELTYPQVLRKEPKLDPWRLREKIGMRPKVDGKMSYPELMDNLQKGTIGRLLQYDNGNTIIVEMALPGTELQGPGGKQRFECKIPGDAQWDITKFAYLNKRGKYLGPDRTENKTALSQFIHFEKTNEAFVNMWPTFWPMLALVSLYTVLNDKNKVEVGRKVKRKRQLPIVKWLDKNVFRGKLSKKAPKADMMEEFGKSKAKMISKDTDKDGKATGLTFEDVAGVDHIVDEFRYIISVMDEFKKLQDSQDGKSKGNRPPEGFIKRRMSRIPKPDSEEYLRNPDGELDVEDDEITEARAKLSIPKGVLFEGPPGTGKTLLAKAVAGEAGVPFFYANGSEFVEMFVGVAAKRVRDLFKRAREVSPSIIFIDELDTIGRSRALYNNRDSATLEREAGLLQLLVELDGFDTKSAAGQEQEMVLVMGATNLSSQLDPALLRSGRFERSFHIGVPKRHKDRLEILKVHARKLNVPTEGNDKWESHALLNRTAELTDGYSGASLAALLNEASILSVREDRDLVTLADIERVIERNLVGVSSAPMESGWGKDHRAMVEAGRAVLWSSKQSMNYCSEVLRVTIKPYGNQMTGVMLMPEKSDKSSVHFNGEARADTLDDFIDGLAMLLAGRCVETVFFGPQGVSVQTKGDLVAAADIAYEIVTASGQYPDQSGGFTPLWPQELIEHFQMPAKEMDAGVYDLMVRAHIRAEEYVNYYKPVILQVASELLAHGSLYGSHIRDLVEDHEVRMQLAKDEELANAEARAAEEEERLRKEREFEEAEAARRAAAEAEAERIRAEAAAQVEAEGVAGAIDVESSEAPLSDDPFGTAAESQREAEKAAAERAAASAEEYRGQLGRALRTVGLSGDAFMVRETVQEEEEPAEEEETPLPLPGTPPLDADAESKKRSDPFGEAKGAMAAAAAEAKAITDKETAEKESSKENTRGEDDDEKARLRRALRT